MAEDDNTADDNADNDNRAECDLAALTEAQLAQAFAESVAAGEATEHVGRKNRLAGRRCKIVQELKARGAARAVLQQLAEHNDAQVRKQAKGRLDWLDKPPAEPAPRALRREILWQCDGPPPPALTHDDIAQRLRHSVPRACDRLGDFARPAIGLWPQRRIEIAASASRFGGAPLAPPGWEWPVAEEEPLLFVGQINCAELRGLPGAEQLPSFGLLAFFGDHDAVTGCFPFDHDCVFYWPDIARLVPAKAAIEPLETFPCCALTPRPLVDLPHPFSSAIEDLNLNERQQQSYFDAWLEIRGHGIPHDVVNFAGFSKLLGWPALVQHDLDQFESGDQARLLLQVDKYCNGEEYHSWGPGGSLYYVLSERDLRFRAYERCELEGQFT
jgi:uncharacterized protein YwqG